MRYSDLNELRGIKSLMPDKLKRGVVKGSGIVAIMKQHGFKSIGGASTFAYVFSYESNPNLVLKDFGTKDGYMDFIDFCRHHPENSALPKFKGNPVKVTDGVYAIRIEKLLPIPKQEWYNGLYNMTFNMKCGNSISKERKKAYPILYATLKLLYQYRDKWSLDWHENNFMKRSNGDIVIIDPFSWHNN